MSYPLGLSGRPHRLGALASSQVGSQICPVVTGPTRGAGWVRGWEVLLRYVSRSGKKSVSSMGTAGRAAGTIPLLAIFQRSDRMGDEVPP
jgi:hypothetical protein